MYRENMWREVKRLRANGWTIAKIARVCCMSRTPVYGFSCAANAMGSTATALTSHVVDSSSRRMGALDTANIEGRVFCIACRAARLRKPIANIAVGNVLRAVAEVGLPWDYSLSNPWSLNFSVRAFSVTVRTT